MKRSRAPYKIQCAETLDIKLKRQRLLLHTNKKIAILAPTLTQTLTSIITKSLKKKNNELSLLAFLFSL